MKHQLFRAWHEEHKEMVYFNNEKASKDIYIAKHFFDLASKGKLEEYIGIVDYHGENIYENDIVHISGIGECDVKWSESELCWLFIKQITESEFYYQDIIEEDIQIRGNIHNNPNLTQ